MAGRLVVKNAFGLIPNSTHNLAFFDHNLIYSCGGYTVVANTETKEQSFIPSYLSQIPGHVSLGTTAIACCYPKKFIAVAEKADTGAVVIFYDSHSLRKKKVLAFPELGSKEIKCIAFSDCARYCLTMGGSPDWNLVLWAVEKTAKVVSVIKISPSDDTPVHQVSFCPWDSSHIVVIGKNLIKFFRIFEGTMRPAAQAVRKDQANFISHCWLPDDMLILGTESGEILLMENGEYKGVIYPTGHEQPEDVTPSFSFCGTSRGFIAGTVDGELRMFERKSDSKDSWEIIKRFIVPGVSKEQPRGKVRAIAMGPDDYLAVATDMQQLFTINVSTMYQPDNVSEGGEGGSKLFTPVISQFHSPNVRGDAAITAIDAALWKPIIATTGKDKTVRIWNTNDKRVESVREFDEEPTSVALHPSGLYLAVGFLEKVQVIALLLDGFNLCREVSVRSCNLVRFSQGGQYFAVCAGTVAQIFHTHTGALAYTLRGHTNKIKAFTWLELDSHCITVGGEGSVFYWDLTPAGPVKSSEKQHVNIVPFQAGAGPRDGTKSYIATAERVVRELSFAKTIDPATGLEIPLKEPRDVETGRNMTTMIFDETKRMLLVGTAEEEAPGSVLAMLTLPQLSTNIEATTLHSGPITAMCLSVDGNRLYTGDANGCLVISEFDGVTATTGKTGQGKIRGEVLVSFEFQEEVAIRKNTLDSKKALIRELGTRVEELTLNNEHQLRLKELEHKDKMGEIGTKFGAMLSEEQKKYDESMQGRAEMVAQQGEEGKALDEKHAKQFKDIEKKYHTKKNAEDTRHKTLLGEVEETHARWNEENLALVTSHQSYIKELCSDYEQQLGEEIKQQQEFLRQKEEAMTSSAVREAHIDEDADIEVLEINEKFESRLRQEDAVGKDLMAQHALIRKQLQLLVKDGDTQKDEIKRLRDREARLQDTLRSLDKDIQSHKKEIREREETITEKEKRIFDLKKKNQELEKFRFVLDYKIRELKLQIAPREAETAALRRQSEEMALELEQYHKSGQALDLMLAELRLKAEGLRKELVNQEERCTCNSHLLEKFKRDLRAAWSVRTDAAAFKAKVVKLYRVYVQEDVSGSSSGGDTSDPQEVYNRDREQLERSLEALRRALKTDAIAHKRDLGKMMREGVLLTGELNTLRKDSRQLTLQKKAIDGAGPIGPRTNLVELMSALGLETKKKKKMAPTAGPAGGPLPTPPGIKTKGARSAALRNTTPFSGGGGAAALVQVEPYKGDMWTAWREIQLQTQTMQELEEKLQTACYALSIDPLQVLVSIDNKLAHQ